MTSTSSTPALPERLVINFTKLQSALRTLSRYFVAERLLGGLDNGRWEALCNKHETLPARPVLFLGDSMMARWPMAPSFGTMRIVNRGVHGSQAIQSIARVKEQLARYRPTVTCILIGTNDLRKGATVQATAGSIEEMVKLAGEVGSRSIVCSVLPVCGVYPSKYPPGAIRHLNAALEQIAADHHASFVDAYSKMVDEDDHLRRAFTNDGLHLNRDGYMRLSALLHPPLMQACYLEAERHVSHGPHGPQTALSPQVTAQ